MNSSSCKTSLVFAGCLATLLGAWTVTAMAQTSPAPQVSNPPPDRRTAVREALPLDATKLRSVATALRPNASEAEVTNAVQILLPEMLTASVGDGQAIANTLKDLARQPRAAEAFARSYRQLSRDAFPERLLTIGFVGELKQQEAMPFLSELVWERLPAKEANGHSDLLSERELEEMIQAKAVQGLAYLGIPEADAAVQEVMIEHESLHVRETAVDAYMWNHGDSPETAKELYSLLPKDMHPLIERPRFQAGMDPEVFTARLTAWRAKWAPRGLPE